MKILFFLFLFPLSRAFFNNNNYKFCYQSYFHNNRRNNLLKNDKTDEVVEDSYYSPIQFIIRIYQPSKNTEKNHHLFFKLYPRLKLLIPNPNPNNNNDPYSLIKNNMVLLLTTIPVIIILQSFFSDSQP